jgi:hypothetical protein
MQQAIRLRVTIGEDRTIRLPDDVPIGEVEIIVLFPADPVADEARRDPGVEQAPDPARGQK